MADEKTETTKKKAPDLGERIPVKGLTFEKAVTLPNGNIASNMQARKESGSAYYEIDFVPRIRQYLVKVWPLGTMKQILELEAQASAVKGAEAKKLREETAVQVWGLPESWATAEYFE
jgi:hypothetical protein